MPLHPHLLRQLKRTGLAGDALPGDTHRWSELIELVSRAYFEHDENMKLLERGQALASEELTELNRMHAESEERLRSLVQLSADWVWETDSAMRLRYVSENVAKTVGVSAAALLGKRTFSQDGYEDVWESRDRVADAIAARVPFKAAGLTVHAADGSTRHVSLSGTPVKGPDGAFLGYRGIGVDFTAAKSAEEELHRLAHFDRLTGLPNRAMLTGRLDLRIRLAAEKGNRVAICFVDLDMFKAINDRFGHAAGDQVLKEVATRISDALRDGDLVARMGGDEFVVLFGGQPNEAGLRAAGKRILDAIRMPMNLQGTQIEMTGSIGMSIFPADAQSADGLLRNADAAMYHAKDLGKNRVEFYRPEMEGRSARQMELVSEVRQAFARGEFMLYYQPKVDLRTGRLQSLEALLRWNHPNRGIVSPAGFLPVIEEFGMSVDVGRWVIREACMQMSAWRTAGIDVPGVAINVNVQQVVEDTLISDIFDAVTAARIDCGAIELELTESMLMAQPERANEVLDRLEGMGVKVAIDDFGTGYSSLAYLRRLHVDVLKIDRSFIQGIADNEDDAAIVRAVIAMAHGLGLQVVAEGVETPQQLDALRALDGDIVQGYLLGRPMPAHLVSQALVNKNFLSDHRVPATSP